MPRRLPALAATIALLPHAGAGQAVLSAEGMAGIGVQGCETVAGAENAPVLAAAVDWGLGYLAGRRDGGHRPVAGEPLSTTDPADLATSIVLYCRQNPYGLVLDALRAYGLRVFAEGPEADPSQQPRLPRIRPRRRPDAVPEEAQAAALRARGRSADAPAGTAVEGLPPPEIAPEPGAIAEPSPAAGDGAEPELATRSARRFVTVATAPTRIEQLGRRRRAIAAQDARARGILPPLAPPSSPRPAPRP